MRQAQKKGLNTADGFLRFFALGVVRGVFDGYSLVLYFLLQPS